MPMFHFFIFVVLFRKKYVQSNMACFIGTGIRKVGMISLYGKISAEVKMCLIYE